MTEQVRDEVGLEGLRYSLLHWVGGPLIEPDEHGLKVSWQGLGTDCHRGFICRYDVDRDELCLVHLTVAPEEEPGPETFLGGTRGTGGSGGTTYGRMRFQTRFTGTMLIGAEYNNANYRTRGAPLPWMYDQVRELVFAEGRLISTLDRSADMARLHEADTLRHLRRMSAR